MVIRLSESRHFTRITASHDWFNKGILNLSQPVQFPTNAVYRGWMMKPEQYEGFYSQLLESKCPACNYTSNVFPDACFPQHLSPYPILY